MVHGISKNADLDPSLLQREIRPLRYRMREFFAFGGGAITAMLAFTALILPFLGYPSATDPLLLLSFIFLLLSKKNIKTYPLRRPMDDRDPDPKSGKTGDGIFLIGNELETGSTVWINNDDSRTHMLVFGSTGSGKTRFLLSLFYQALLLGSGVMYVDGKGDTTVFGLVFSMVRRLGREDDLMLINYLTGSKSSNDEDDGSRLSNTTNPFAYGPAETLRSLIVSLMRDGGGDDMWKGRASALLAAMLQTLVYLRDRGEVNLDVGMIRDSMPLDRVLEFAQRDDIPEEGVSLLKKYLLDLPGYNEEDAIQGELSPKCYEQHGYLTMQLTEVLSELSSTYKHIFGASLGEVDYKDLVYNRRILFVMLPALEKDPDALSGLGKLVVAGVRSALAPALGEKVEGSHEEVMDAKPTNSTVPFLLILDEYGYYSVKGFSIVAAQARSLGIGVVFAGQDFPSFKKGSEDEAKSVVANTNVKVFMKVEDQGETLALARDRGGDGETVQASGHEMKGEIISGYQDTLQTRSERRNRINIRDLVSQTPGQAHVMFGDVLVRCQLYYTEPNTSPEYRINKMLMVKRPRREIINNINRTRDSLNNLFKKGSLGPDKLQNMDMDTGVRALFNAYGIAVSRKQEPVLASQIAIGMMEHQERLLDEDFVLQMKGLSEPVPQVEQIKKEVSKPDSEARVQKSSPNMLSETKTLAAAKNPVQAEHNKDQDIADALDFTLPFLATAEESDDSLRQDAKVISLSLTQMINEQIESEISKSKEVLSSHEKDMAMPVNQLAMAEKGRGLDEEGSLSEAMRGLGIIDERIQYPVDPQPKKLSEDTVSQTLESMLKQIERSKQQE